MTTMTKPLRKANPVIKTVLAPNAPWPKWEQNPVVKKKPANHPKIKMDNSVLDYFSETRDEINKAKTSDKHRVRDRISGRFTFK